MKIAAIGECMAELTVSAPGEFRMGFAGDTYNTAVYLKRLLPQDSAVHFITAIGDDWLSKAQVATMRDEGLEVDAATIRDASPALYFVKTDKTGERTFTYYRDASPVRQLLGSPWDDQLTNDLGSFDLIYFSAITLQMMTEAARNRLWPLLADARKSGTIIAFDSNYRRRGWPTVDHARAAIDTARAHTDIALPSLSDELALNPDANWSTVINGYVKRGTSEVVLKDGAGDVRVLFEGHVTEFPLAEILNPVDTTGAGDAFNAGYLASRITGGNVSKSVDLAQRLARIVISTPGGITPSGQTHALRLPGVPEP